MKSGASKGARAGPEGPHVVILMGSASDKDAMGEAVKVLSEFGVSHAQHVTSAHRTPARTERMVREYQDRGTKVFIAGAGGAAHLAGMVAAHTLVPVIGVPLDSSPLRGFDALLSTAQMPPGVPVACMGVGRWGARNAGMLAVQILALNQPALKEALGQYRRKVEKDVDDADKKISRGG